MTPMRTPLTDDFTGAPEGRWRFFTDRVMGGVSTGDLSFFGENGRAMARMTGEVSTANRGGFIQMRRDLPPGAAANTKGIRLVARGNDQTYFVHLRSLESARPWQFYQADFPVTADWAEMHLPFTVFAPRAGLPDLRPEHLTTLAVAAYGRDHGAEIHLAEIGLF